MWFEEKEGDGWQMDGGAKEIEAPTLGRRSLPSKETGQAIPTRKEWVKGIPLKVQLSGRG